MAITPEEAFAVFKDADLIFSERELSVALDTMAQVITAQLQHNNPLVLCVLNGGLIPMGYLVTRLNFPLQVDYLHATRYRGNTVGGALHWIARPQLSLKDRVVLLVDDILDEGHTLKAIVDECYLAGAAQVRSAVLLEKMHGREKATAANYVGLEVADRYVFGFGMDYKEYLRNVPGVYAVREDR
ncbi:MAG: hypoxanthine phosphoribosyltransferase [Halothiobacillaceae bacterium]|nr:MAG: hypoxanthine phosphoribosyltransferase [Halothiobacillaceae bacterium]